MNCHYEYKGIKYNNLSEIYPIVLGEQETNESPVKVTGDKIEVKTPIKSKQTINRDTKVTDIKTREDLNNLTQYKINEYAKEVSIKNLYSDTNSIVMDYFIGGNKINRDSVAQELYGRSYIDVPKQMKSLKWVTESKGVSIEETANTIADNSISNYGVEVDVQDVRNTIIDIINSYENLNDIKLDFIENYLKQEGIDLDNPLPNYSEPIENPITYKDFKSKYKLTDNDRAEATTSMFSGDFITGKRLVTSNGAIIVSNKNPNRFELYQYYKEGDEDLNLTDVLSEQLVDVYAYNMKYEAYLSGTMEEFNTPNIVQTDNYYVTIPSKEEALTFPDKQPKETPFLSATTEQVFNSYGYNPNNDSLTNIKDSLTKIIETTNDPVLKLLAKKYFSNVNQFENIEVILDNEYRSLGVASFRNNESTGIRLNPTRINNADSYAKTLLEEMTHVLVRKESRNENSEVTKRLQSLYEQAKASYGNDLLNQHNKDIERLRELQIKENSIQLTPDEVIEKETIQNIVSDNIDARLVYALSNFDEFIAHIAVNRSLQRHLNNTKETDTQKSLYSKFIDIVLSLLESLGMKSTNTGVFKYALHDLFDIVDISFKQSNIGKSLQAKSTRSKSFVYNKFGLKSENNADIAVANGKEVTDMINSTYSNIVALEDTNTGVIKLYYRDELSKEKLLEVARSLGNEDSINNAFIPLFEEDENDPLNYNPSSMAYEGDSFGFTEGIEAANEFDLQLKIYLSNLNDRERSLQRSKTMALNMDTTLAVDKKKQAIKINEIDEQIKTVRETIKKITDKRSHVIPFNNIIDVAYTAETELESIDVTNFKRSLSASDITYMLQTVMFWKDAKKAVFIEDNYKDKMVNNLYSKIERLAEDKLKTILSVLDQYTIDKVVKKHTKFNGTKEDLAKEFIDVSRLGGLLDNLNVIDSSLLQAIGKEIKEQNEIRGEEVFEQVKAFEKIAKQAIPILKTLSTNKDDIHDIFRQRDRFGRKTKNMVTRLSDAYEKTRKQYLGFVYQSSSDKSNEQAENALKFLRDNAETVKYSVLFPIDNVYNDVEFEAEKERLIGLMGKQYFTEWFTKQSKRIDDFKKYRDIKIEGFKETYNLQTLEEILEHKDAGRYYNHFMELHSPYKIEVKLDNYTKGKKHFTALKNYQSFKYIVDIPKQTFVDNGTETVAYDPAYKTIENNPTVYAYYTAIIESLENIGSIYDYEAGYKLSVNGIPEFKAQMYELFMKDGFKPGMDAFGDYMYDLIRTEKDNKKDVKVDIITGKEKQKIPTGLWSSNSLINQELQTKVIKYTNDNNTTPTEEQIEDWKSEITEKYANDMQGDLSQVIPMFITMGLAYKHKAKIEDSLIIAREMFNHLEEYERDKQGELVTDSSDLSGKSFLKKKPEDSFKRSKEIINASYNSVLYGNRRDIKSTKKKVLSPSEKRQKKNLDDLMQNLKTAYDNKVYGTTEYLAIKKSIQKQIDSLGAFTDTEKRWDLPVRFTQWRGMGWNILGGISNSLFGFTSNLIESAGGQFYTSTDLAKAYSKVYRHSFVRNMTFNKGGGDEAIKIRSLMDRFTIMSDSGSEYKSLVGSDVTERLKWLSAFNMNERTEYVNQAPLMLIVFDKTTFEHNGETYPIYEGFNIDGSWNDVEYGAYPYEVVRKAVLKTKALIERNHGNYNPMSPILAKRTGLGRLVLQFRTWMIEGVRTRLGDRKGRYDEILEAEIKGRYISAYDVFKNDWKGASLGLGLQMIRNFIPFGNKWMANFTPIDKYIQGNENIKEVDIANMKRLAIELNIFIGSMIVLLTAKALASGLDDDDPKKLGLNLLINQGTRLRTDILLYINPMEAKKLIQDPIPSMKILIDVYKLKDAVDKTLLEGSPEYESGIYEGHNRILKNVINLIPGATQAYRLQSQAFQTFDDK